MSGFVSGNQAGTPDRVTEESIRLRIEEVIGTSFPSPQRTPVSGGCIHDSFLWSSGDLQFFVKTNRRSQLGLFTTEVSGLKRIREPGVIRAPTPVCWGTAGDRAYLVLEYIPMKSLTRAGAACMGEQLARLHRVTADRFGWHEDNFIGATPQPNGWFESWCEFFSEKRLRFQFQLAEENGLSVPGSDSLVEGLKDLFEGYEPEPSCLHGDLWGGNASEDEHGNPVIYDPAAYFGDREADLAFTEFFGGFPEPFYESYRKTWPLHPGYARRKDLYNLYHVLNHFNLFGGGYGHQAVEMTARLNRMIDG